MAGPRDDLERLTAEVLSPREPGAAPPDFADAVAKARAAQARAAEAPADESRARALREAWSDVARGLVAWDETRPRPPLVPAETLPSLAETGRRAWWRPWPGLGHVLAAFARRARRKAAAIRSRPATPAPAAEGRSSARTRRDD